MYPGPRVVDPEFRCFVGLCEFLRWLMLFCASINFSLANNNLCFISPLCTIFLNFFSLVSMSFCVTFICLSACLFVQYFVCFTLVIPVLFVQCVLLSPVSFSLLCVFIAPQPGVASVLGFLVLLHSFMDYYSPSIKGSFKFKACLCVCTVVLALPYL